MMPVCMLPMVILSLDMPPFPHTRPRRYIRVQSTAQLENWVQEIPMTGLPETVAGAGTKVHKVHMYLHVQRIRLYTYLLEDYYHLVTLLLYVGR